MGKGKKRGQEEAGAMSTAPAKVPATGAGTAAGGALGGLQHYMCHLQVRGTTHDSLCVHGQGEHCSCSLNGGG